MGFSSKILNNSVGSLIAQQAIIATTSNNIANANTPGYARRTVELQTRAGESGGGQINVGNGVQIGAVNRVVDEFVEKMLREAGADKAGFELENDFLSRVQSVFSLNTDGSTIGSALTEFSTAVNDLAGDPSSIELRTNLIEKGKDLVNAIKVSYGTIASLQDEANTRISTELDTVNNIATQIATLNGQIRTRESTGNVAADERDQRELLLQQLSEKVSYSMVEDSDGAANIFLGKGFALVSGSEARTLEATPNPSFASGSVPPSLSGGVLSYIVYDYDSGAGVSHIDLTQSMQAGSGTIGALLRLRGYNDPSNTSAFDANGSLVDVASRIEAITRSLLTAVNRTYVGGTDENSGTPGFQPTSGDLNGNQPNTTTNPFALFDFDYSGGKDLGASNNLPDAVDLDFLLNGGGTVPISNFSSLLSFRPTDPRTIAAARDADPTNGVTNFPTGDGQNMLALASTLASSNLSFAVGSYSMTGSFGQAYNEALTHVGAEKARVQTNSNVANSNFVAVQARRDSVSGVSLDEEFTNLIKFQKAFQASAKMIKVADELLQQIVSLI